MKSPYANLIERLTTYQNSTLSYIIAAYVNEQQLITLTDPTLSTFNHKLTTPHASLNIENVHACFTTHIGYTAYVILCYDEQSRVYCVEKFPNYVQNRFK